MKIIYHERYTEVYSPDPASMPGRMESIYDELRDDFEFVSPLPASEDDLLLVHGEQHLKHVKRLGLTYQVAALAAGGAIKAAELALSDEPAFGLIRPPGHHASRDSSWGFCYFNNVAISIETLRRAGQIAGALIVDIDLHHGDGTDSIFSGIPEVPYFHVAGKTRKEYLENLSGRLKIANKWDIVAVSAGFDRHERDWGGLLKTEDYQIIGRMIKRLSERRCNGKRYGVLEGGYNLEVLGKNVKSLLEGMK